MNYENPGFNAPVTPEPHTHGYGPIQEYPINDGMPRHAPPPPPPPCTPVPPPIPPVQYVPGLNVQEQLTNMADRVNVAIGRWNQIQANCYAALDQVVGAAVNNDVYYSPSDVRMMEGYSEDASCPYFIVEARAVDRSGKPIFCHLRPAYNNETNSGAQENIQDVSFVTSGQMVLSAIQGTENRWKGTSMFNSNPGNSAPDDTVWIAGWNRNGVLRFFRGDVSQDLLRQNRMVNCIGPIFPVLKGGNLFSECLDTMGAEAASIQAMGWKQNGNKVFFSCGIYDAPGMTPQQVAVLLQRIGCHTAVITSYQTNAATAWDASPIAGTENTVPAGGSSADVITAPGLTAGMTFLGKLVNAPIQWNIPANCAAWVISKRPPNGWANAFTTEVANIVQKMGAQENSMNSILGQLKSENEGISALQYQVTQNTNDIADIKTTVGGFDNRISGLETRLNSAETNIRENAAAIERVRTALDQEVSTREQQYQELKDADAQEAAERQSADAALRAAINTEEAARKSADVVLQNNIDEEASKREAADQKLAADIDSEATTRANADRNLQNAIEAEASARSTKDTQHEARMDAMEAQEQKDVAAIQKELADIKDGSSLPIASKTQLGIVQIGDNLTIDENGVLSAKAGGGEGGDTIEAGAGINITEKTDGTKVVSVDDNVVVTEDELKAAVDPIKSDVSNLSDEVESVKTKQDAQAQELDDLSAEVNTAKENISNLNSEVADISYDVAGIKSGEDLPIATADKLGAIKVGANLSISEDGTLSASAGEGGSGETVAGGTGITVEHDDETGVATVGLNETVQGQLASIADKADASAVSDVTTALAGKADRSDVKALQDTVEKNTADIAAADEKIDEVDTKATAAASGVSVLNSNVTALDTRLGAAEANVDALTTQQEKNTEDIATIQEHQTEIDGNVESAINMAADAEKAAAEKVAKAGDTMSGNLTLEGAKLVLAAADGTIIGTLGTSEGGILTLNDGNLGNVILRGIQTPLNAADAANKGYVDSSIQPVSEAANSAASSAADAASLATEAKGAAQTAQNRADEAYAKAEESGGDFLPLSGGTMTGVINELIGGKLDVNTPANNRYALITPSGLAITKPSTSQINLLALAPTSQVVDGVATRGIILTPGATASGMVELSGIATPTGENSAATKYYVDSSHHIFRYTWSVTNNGNIITDVQNTNSMFVFFYSTSSGITFLPYAFKGYNDTNHIIFAYDAAGNVSTTLMRVGHTIANKLNFQITFGGSVIPGTATILEFAP